MASVLRTGLANLNPTGLLFGLCKGLIIIEQAVPKGRNVPLIQIAGISSREVRRDRAPRPPPYDYKNKKTGIWCYHTDPMLERFDDNTKVVVVEGMPAVGKDKFAKRLAQELEMKYIPPPKFDDRWIDDYGFDLRSLNKDLPVEAQFYDLTTFFKDPKHMNVFVMQMAMLWSRCSQYIDALAHVLSTGEGVVLQRTPWTDPVFIQAMANCGYVSKGALDYHQCAVKGTLFQYMKPHLLIYLDAPVSVVKQNIKKRNVPFEADSKAFTDEYLRELEKHYKKYLEEMSKHAHMLIYDWSTEGDVGVVVEDIERLDFDSTSNRDSMFQDWSWDRAFEIKQKRYDFCEDKYALLAPLLVCRLDVPEMLLSAEASAIRQNILDEVPSQRYAPGFNPGLDKGLLFKTKPDPVGRKLGDGGTLTKEN